MEDGSVEILWFDDWYDGPLSGLARVSGREYWFAIDDSRDWVRERPRHYLLYQLSGEELEDCKLANDEGRYYSGRWGDDVYNPPNDRPAVGAFDE